MLRANRHRTRKRYFFSFLDRGASIVQMIDTLQVYVKPWNHKLSYGWKWFSRKHPDIHRETPEKLNYNQCYRLDIQCALVISCWITHLIFTERFPTIELTELHVTIFNSSLTGYHNRKYMSCDKTWNINFSELTHLCL